MSTIADNIELVSQRIRAAADAAQRDASSIRLLAVSKTKPAQAVREAYAAGMRDFGENYLQEALGKQAELTDLPLSWHFIGPIQSNKTRAIAEHFAWVHSVDRLKIAQRLSEQRPADLPPRSTLFPYTTLFRSTGAGQFSGGLRNAPTRNARRYRASCSIEWGR